MCDTAIWKTLGADHEMFELNASSAYASELFLRLAVCNCNWFLMTVLNALLGARGVDGTCQHTHPCLTGKYQYPQETGQEMSDAEFLTQHSHF